MTRLLPVLLFIMLIAPGYGYSQLENTWSFQQLDSLQQIEKRPILVFIYADWCRYCRAMEHTTFQDEAVKAWLDSTFYMVSLDAETKQDIEVRDQTFHYQPTGNGTGQHELAQALGSIEGKLTLPTLSFLSADYTILYQQPGFLKPNELTTILKAVYELDQANQIKSAEGKSVSMMN